MFARADIVQHVSSPIGYATVCGNSHGFYKNYDSNWQYQNITVLEYYQIVVAIKVLGKMLTNHCIIKHCSDQTYKDTMALVRQLVVSCLSFNMYLKAKHLTLC